jgi:hypothetical protein
MLSPSRLVAAAGAAVIVAACACASATSEPDSLLFASNTVSEAGAPLLSDFQLWWTGAIVMSMLFGTTIWSFVKFGTDEGPR